MSKNKSKTKYHSEHEISTVNDDLILKNNNKEVIIESLKDSSSSSNGSLHVKGGAGIEKNLNVGADLGVENNATIQGSLTAKDVFTETLNGRDDLIINGSDIDIICEDIDIEQKNLNNTKNGTFARINSNSSPNVLSLRNYNEDGHGVSISTSNFNESAAVAGAKHLDLHYMHPQSIQFHRLLRIGAKNMRRDSPENLPNEWEAVLRSEYDLSLEANETLRLAGDSVISNGGIVSHHRGTPLAIEGVDSLPSASSNSDANNPQGDWFHPKLHTIALEKKGRFCASWVNLYRFELFARATINNTSTTTLAEYIAFSETNDSPPSNANIVGTFFELPSFLRGNSNSPASLGFSIHDVSILWKPWASGLQGNMNGVGRKDLDTRTWHGTRSLFGGGSFDSDNESERGMMSYISDFDGSLILAWRTDSEGSSSGGNVAISASSLYANPLSGSTPTWPNSGNSDHKFIWGANLDIRVLITYRKN